MCGDAKGRERLCELIIRMRNLVTLLECLFQEKVTMRIVFTRNYIWV